MQAPLLLILTATIIRPAVAQFDEPWFPIGQYFLPDSEEDLREAAEAGVNLVRCRSARDLDRVARAGLRGWVRVPIGQGDSPKLRKIIESLRDHPALAVWEGPDELVWHFTANWKRLLDAGVFRDPWDWWKQTPEAVRYAERTAAETMPRLREGIRVLRRMDPHRRPIWFNEAAQSDLKYIRQYVDLIDIIGCDYYPVTSRKGLLREVGDDYYPVKFPGRILSEVGDYTERFRQIGRNKPVWMVLQGFSWHLVPEAGLTQPAYPSFAQSRTMAYDAIVHGARALLFWGLHLVPPGDEPFRRSIYALTSELSMLHAFLAAPDVSAVTVNLIDSRGRIWPEERGVRIAARCAEGEWIIILVNEDDRAHMGVEVRGLEPLEGKTLKALYAEEESAVHRGSLITRLMPLETKVFATSRRFESMRREGRDFGR